MLFFRMMNNDFKNKKILLMGLGILGRGVGDAIFLAEKGAELTITDTKSAEDLSESLEKLSKYSNIEYVLGKHEFKDFENKDFVIKSAGVPINSPYIEHARKNGVRVEMSTAIFAKNTKAKLIGVTGTKGKSSVTYMLCSILKSAGKNVYLGGNVRGISTLALLDKVGVEDYVIMELDSWQLQGFGESGISPWISVFTNIMPDHMNYYQSDMRQYFLDKANIFLNQNRGDYFIAGDSVLRMALEFGLDAPKARVTSVLNDDKYKGELDFLKGDHSRKNALFAMQIAAILNISAEIITKALKEFRGVEGRLEFVKEVGGVRFYNDTTATVPESTIAAIRAFDGQRVVLIAGGNNKDLDYKVMTKLICENIDDLVLLPGSATDKIIENLNENYKFMVVGSMNEAVEVAFRKSRRGGVVLMSPGATSFGIFKNEFDRGSKFLKSVRGIYTQLLN